MSKHITSTFFENVKKSAKKLKKNLNIPHSEALDLASQKAGYPTYHALITAYKKQIQTPTNLDSFIREALTEIIDSEYNRKEIDVEGHIISKNHNDAEDIHSLVRSKLLEIFDNGINHTGVNISADWSVCRYGIDKESLKDMGYELIEFGSIEERTVGALIVCLGHFYRSAADCYVSRRLIHPNFNTYLTDWIRSTAIIGSDSSQILLEMYPENKYNGLAKGTSYWKTPNY
ncbi:hypothetical protein [Shewanella marina]|uniref:hypothetical protein n=1 Tax=Shewanella marina TaxID=487319 RepID=UPI0004715952|nr:hypothetical protein [Shewanella marina]